MASALSLYQTLTAIGTKPLADFLGCSPRNLPMLSLCRRPDPASSNFRPDVEKIATYVGANPRALVRLIREVEAHEALVKAEHPTETTVDSGMLMAARDRAEEESTHDEGHSDVSNDIDPGPGNKPQ